MASSGCSVQAAGLEVGLARDWIEMLTELARQQDRAVPTDPRFDALLDGTLPEGEKERLEKDAAVRPEILAALAACRPIDDAVKDRLVRRAQTDLSAPPTGERDPLAVPDELELVESKPPTRPKLTARRSARHWILILAAAFVGAAGLAAYLTRPPDHPVLCSYDLAVRIADPSASRGLVLELSPRGDGARAQDVRLFVNDRPSGDVIRAADLKRLDVPGTQSGNALIFEVPGIVPGPSSNSTSELVLVAVAGGKVPSDVAELDDLLRDGSRRVVVFRQTVRSE